VEPSRAGLVAAGPGVPVRDVPRRPGPDGSGGEQVPDLRDGERDQARVGGRGWSGRTGPGAWVPVRSRSSAAVTAQIARAAMTSTVCRAIAAYSLTWGWSRPKQSLPNSKPSSGLVSGVAGQPGAAPQQIGQCECFNDDGSACPATGTLSPTRHRRTPPPSPTPSSCTVRPPVRTKICSRRTPPRTMYC
jgi:hypothetical protein